MVQKFSNVTDMTRNEFECESLTGENIDNFAECVYSETFS